MLNPVRPPCSLKQGNSEWAKFNYNLPHLRNRLQAIKLLIVLLSTGKVSEEERKGYRIRTPGTKKFQAKEDSWLHFVPHKVDWVDRNG